MGDVSEAQLASRAGTVRRLVEVGVLVPSSDGQPFEAGDVPRIRLAESLDGSGVSLDDLGSAIASGHLSFGFVGSLFSNDTGYVPGTTMRAFAERHGLSMEMVEAVHVRFGLPRPSPEDPVRTDEIELFPMASAALGFGMDEAALVRFMRVLGENLRRLAEAQVTFFDTLVLHPMSEAGISQQQVWDAAAAMGSSLGPMLEQLILWLFRRHQEHAVMEDVVEHVEITLDGMGLGSPRPSRPPAIAFLDLSGSTRLTEDRGDAAAAELASSLAELVQEASHAHRGRPVKLLGDGVMFHFADPADAVACALDLVERAPAAGLPPARVGVNAGTEVFRDGDYFGRTVNVASRIADHARPAQVVVSDAFVEVARRGGAVAFEPLGPARLKGVAEPVELYVATRVVRSSTEGSAGGGA